MISAGAHRLGRRSLLKGAAAGLGLGMLGSRPWAAGGLGVEPMAGGLSLITGTGGNQLAVATGDGLVLVDSGAARDGAALLETLAELAGTPVAALFNTHWHPDQVGSNEALGSRGTPIYAHVKTEQRLRAGYYVPDEDRYEPALAAPGLPTETFYEHGAAEIGGASIEYGYLIEAHTDGDIYVAFRDRNVIAVGGVLAPDRDPVFDWYGGGWLGGRLDSIELLLQSSDADTRFVPSHGPVVDRAGVEAERDMLQTLFDRIVEHIRKGETARDMLELGVLDGLGREFADPYRLLYDLQKGFWANHDKLMHDIV